MLWSFRCLSNSFLKPSMPPAEATTCGREFHILATLRPCTHDRVSRQNSARNSSGAEFCRETRPCVHFRPRKPTSSSSSQIENMFSISSLFNEESWLAEILGGFTQNSTSKTMSFARRVPRTCVRGLSVTLFLFYNKKISFSIT